MVNTITLIIAKFQKVFNIVFGFRYIVVCHPLMAHPLSSTKSAVWAATVVVIFSIICSTPTWIELLSKLETLCATNEVSKYYSLLTDFGIADKGNYYVQWLYTTVALIVPLSILIYFNTIIHKQVSEQ